MVGPRSFKMLMQPLDDGNVCGRWNAVDGSEADESPDGGGPMVDDVSTRIGAGRPLTLGDIPGQDAGDEGFPSFLLLRDPGAGWQIWRRSTARAGSGEQRHREETYTWSTPCSTPTSAGGSGSMTFLVAECAWRRARAIAGRIKSQPSRPSPSQSCRRPERPGRICRRQSWPIPAPSSRPSSTVRR